MTMEAVMTEAQGDSERKVILRSPSQGEACAPCWYQETRQWEVFWSWVVKEPADEGRHERMEDPGWVW